MVTHTGTYAARSTTAGSSSAGTGRRSRSTGSGWPSTARTPARASPGARRRSRRSSSARSADGTSAHLANWLDCIRTRKTPTAPIRRRRRGRARGPHREPVDPRRLPGALGRGRAARSRGPERWASGRPRPPRRGLALPPGCRRAEGPKGGAGKPAADRRRARRARPTSSGARSTPARSRRSATSPRRASTSRSLWKGPLREDDREQQVQVVESFASQGIDGIVLAPLDEKALVRPVEEAKRLGVPTVIMDSALASDQIVSFVATDNVKGGEMGADALGRAPGRQGPRPPAALPGGLGQHHRARGGLPRAAEGRLARPRAARGRPVRRAPRATPPSGASENLLNRHGRDLAGHLRRQRDRRRPGCCSPSRTRASPAR